MLVNHAVLSHNVSFAYHISCEVSKTPCEKPVQSYVITLFFLQLLNDTFHVKSMRNRYA